MLKEAIEIQRLMFLCQENHDSANDEDEPWDYQKANQDVVNTYLSKRDLQYVYYNGRVVLYDTHTCATVPLRGVCNATPPLVDVYHTCEHGRQHTKLRVEQYGDGSLTIQMFDVHAVELLVELLKSTWQPVRRLEVLDGVLVGTTVNTFTEEECRDHRETLRRAMADACPKHVIVIDLKPHLKYYIGYKGGRPDELVNLNLGQQQSTDEIMDIPEESDALQCEVCWHNKKIISLSCGHVFCYSCTKDTTSCPKCRQNTGYKRRVYL